ncbi:MAG: protein translocase subunit SecF [Bacteroidetes bacterium]|nr:protein translocase subunit SecF [Bacteroidota bacterium]
MRIFENANFSFIQNRTKGYIFSGLLVLASIGSFAVNGLELGIDFMGGMEFVIETSEPLDVVQVRSALMGVLTSDPEVKTFGGNALLIRTLPMDDVDVIQSLILSGINDAFPNTTLSVQKTDNVGPRFAQDLAKGAIFSIFGSLLVIFVYILIRFEWRFGVGAVAALFHDVIITLGFFSLLKGILPFSTQIDQTIIAAFLTIVGYSLNDTVVVFDRIREYTALFKAESYNDVVNRSINNTLSRTIVTSGTTLLVVGVLFIFGGEVLRGFAFALIIGILIGTYSSIFVASPILIELKKKVVKRR